MKIFITLLLFSKVKNNFTIVRQFIYKLKDVKNNISSFASYPKGSIDLGVLHPF